MKTFWVGGLLLFSAGFSIAQPPGARVLTNGADAPLVVMPISVQDEEPPASPRLRDVLRHPFDDQQVLANKPYRLSLEERHRLREQLRGQANAGRSKNKP